MNGIGDTRLKMQLFVIPKINIFIVFDAKVFFIKYIVHKNNRIFRVFCQNRILDYIAINTLNQTANIVTLFVICSQPFFIIRSLMMLRLN